MKSAINPKVVFHEVLVFFFVFALFTMTGCGGGSSSGGGGGGAPAQHVGTYNVSGQVNVTVPNGVSTTVPFTGSVIVIAADGTVTLDPNTAVSGSGTLNGNSFSVSISASSLNDSELTCTGTITLSGSVSGNTVSGTISGSNTVCNSVAMTITGTFSGTKSATSSLLPSDRGESIAKALQQVIRKVK